MASNDNFDPIERLSPRSQDSDDPDLQIDSGDSVSQRVRPHYKQNSHAHPSPRAAKYREGGSMRLTRIITVPGDPMPSPDQASRPHRPSQSHDHSQSHAQPTGHRSFQGHDLRSSAARGTLRGLNLQSHIGGSLRGFAPSVSTHYTRHMANNEVPGSVAFRRPRSHHGDRKEHQISQFHIELSQHERHRYLPGEELKGVITVHVHQELEIRFMELLVIGQTSAAFVHRDSGKATQKRDVFLHKRSYIMGSPDGRYNSVIRPGHYASSFCFQLPSDAPSSLHHEDRIHGFTVDTGYLVKVRLCDDIGASSTRSVHSVNNLVKVLLSRRQVFLVRRPFDIHSVPNGLSPVVHSESVSLNCCVFGVREPATIDLILDRTCFLVGDDIIVRLETVSKNASRIKKVGCILQQSITVHGIRYTANFNVASVEEKYPKGKVWMQKQQSIVGYEIVMPTMTNFLPSLQPGCRLVKVRYHLLVSVKFRSCGGRLLMRTPVSLGPSTDPGLPDKNSAVPMFHKPLRFTGHFAPEHTPNGHPGVAMAREKKMYYKATVSSRLEHNTCSNTFCCCGNGGTMD